VPSNSQIAAVVTYIRNSWGNAASRVNANTVGTLRGRLSSVGN
jgi:mono/diheme cytochrome c family protein